MPTTLSEWVDYIRTLHHHEIELSLERVQQVFRRAYPDGVKFTVISIAGTNGKGSTAELISSIYSEAGYRVGQYTSPYILKLNECYKIDQVEIDDQQLLASFNRVEESRGSTQLTFFEFGTLVAIDLFSWFELDIAVMEIGMGGRLDAVNILPPEVAVVTNVSMDHIGFLGNSIEEIARNKIGIARAGGVCVLGMASPPQSISDYCEQHAIRPFIYKRDFEVQSDPDNKTWVWRSKDCVYGALPLPFGQQGHQIVNAAVALQVVTSLATTYPVTGLAIRAGIANASISARCQLISSTPFIVLDVAHNVDSVASLTTFVQGLQIKGRVYAVCGMLADKQIAETLAQLIDKVDEWHFATIDNPRGASAAQIENILRKHVDALPMLAGISSQTRNLDCYQYDSAGEAYNSAHKKLKRDDCLIVFGSFFIVSDIIGLI